MQSFESYMITYLLEIAPIVLVMGLAIYFLWKDNRDLVKYTRERDKENLETLQDISNFLETYIHEQRESVENTTSTIKQEAIATRQHIDQRIEILKE
ncbi:MAG: hypothetical protein LAT55_13775, partial [Opitutales bacterium]|nr:hypothetical protein [Opitutales bacterium]